MNKEMIALHNISASNPVAETVQTGEGWSLCIIPRAFHKLLIAVL